MAGANLAGVCEALGAAVAVVGEVVGTTVASELAGAGAAGAVGSNDAVFCAIACDFGVVGEVVGATVVVELAGAGAAGAVGSDGAVSCATACGFCVTLGGGGFRLRAGRVGASSSTENP